MLPRIAVIADKVSSLTDPRVLWPTFGLVVILLVAAVILSWFDRWRKRTDVAVTTPAQQLDAFRLSYERGELSPEEYKRIKTRLAPRIKEQLNVPKSPGPTPTDEPPAAPSHSPPVNDGK